LRDVLNIERALKNVFGEVQSVLIDLLNVPKDAFEVFAQVLNIGGEV
jgi:hypothetical protein